MKPHRLLVYLAIALVVYCAWQVQAADRPNVLLIICDDLNDSVEGMGGHPQARTPHLDALMHEGVRFTNAHCAAPVCGPSRASLWTGIYPHHSGVYGHIQNDYTWRDSPVLKDAVTVFEHFAAYGYQVGATGKIFHNNHHTPALIRRLGGRDAMGAGASFGPFPWDGQAKSPFVTAHPSMKKPWGDGGFETVAPLSDVPRIPADPEKGIPGYFGWRDRGRAFRYLGPDDRDLMNDEKSAAWAAAWLSRKHAKPFFLTVGMMRPHCPWVTPGAFFDMFDPNTVQRPPYRTDDLEDCGPLAPGRPGGNSWSSRLHRIRQAYPQDEGWKMWVRGYLACVAFVDHEIGKVLDALEAGPHADDTLVIVTSDHGFHMGEKNLLRKNTVWEESTRVPLIVRLPQRDNIAGRSCDLPVSLIDLYPTLIDLCGLPTHPNAQGNGQALDGHSLRDLLEDTEIVPDGRPPVALTAVTGRSQVKVGDIPSMNEQHFSVRSRHWRYCRWSDGFDRGIIRSVVCRW